MLVHKGGKDDLSDVRLYMLFCFLCELSDESTESRASK